MAECRSCGAPIKWIKTTAGRSMPCDAEGRTYKENPNGAAVIITESGNVVRADIDVDSKQASGVGYISHFATCPNANRHRRR